MRLKTGKGQQKRRKWPERGEKWRNNATQTVAIAADEKHRPCSTLGFELFRTSLDLHSESISLKTDLGSLAEQDQVSFEPFTGVGARRFLDLFSLSLGSGSKLKRKNKQGGTVEWKKESAVARTPLLPKSYLEVEGAVSEIWKGAFPVKT